MITSPRIERGAALLDQHAPGWTTTVDLETLDLGSETHCVLGQIYGRYGHGLAALNGDAADEPERYGYDLLGYAETYAELTAKWVLYIAKRLRQSS